MSRICLSLTGKTLYENIQTINSLRNHIDMVEIRGDFLDDNELNCLRSFPGMTRLPVILTLRRNSDGGRFAGNEDERKRILFNALKERREGIRHFAFVDLEGDLTAPEIDRAAAGTKTRIIRSIHDFKKVPANLGRIIRELPRNSNEIPKAAVMPGSTADLLSIFTAAEELKNIPGILLGMGDYGFPSRILSKKCNSFLTYCSKKGNIAAPGHMEPEQLSTIYNFREINKSTAIFGIIGNPVMHSKSPLIHNRGFRGISLDAVYIPFQVDNLRSFFDLADKLDIRGVSVTIPHKEKVMSFLSGRSKEVDLIGSCNTIIRGGEGWKGFNTDYTGFLAPLSGSISNKMRASVIGAGGAAKAVVYALRERGLEVLILNRTIERAKKLGDSSGCRWGGLDSEGIGMLKEYSDIIIQTTGAGMSPLEDLDPLSGYDFSGKELVYDLIYAPPVTKFLKRAADAGCVTISGKEMLLEQAYSQFLHFTGKDYPFMGQKGNS